MSSNAWMSVAVLVPVLGPAQRTECLDIGDQTVDRFRQLLSFGGGGPDQLHAFLFDAHRFQRVLQHVEASHRLVVLFNVMAFAGVAACDHHAVGSQRESLEYERGIDAATAHDANDTNIGCVRDARRARQVGGTVRAPVAEEPNDFRFETVVAHGISLLLTRTPRRPPPCREQPRALQTSHKTPSISAKICRLLKWAPVITPAGQAETQVPQPLQRAVMM